jgi:hypothetical protein
MYIQFLHTWCYGFVGLVCSCPEYFRWIGSCFFDGQPSWSFVVGVCV